MSDPLNAPSKSGRKTLVVCAIAASALVATVAGAAQARRDGPQYAFSYEEAVSCAGALSSVEKPAGDPGLVRAYLRYSLAASELGRRSNVAPATVDKAIAASARQLRTRPNGQRKMVRGNCIQRLGRI